MRTFKFSRALAAMIAIIGCMTSCNDNLSNDKPDIDKGHMVSVVNGQVIGLIEDNGVLAYKGIPYAKAPVDNLRWKAPQPVEASKDTIFATDFGNSALQAYSKTEVASTRTRSEDCLTLNVWTKDVTTKGKPVMLYIHGGSYACGGSCDPLYDGKYLVADNPDIVLVTINYRVNMMGFIDFSHVPGGEAFPDAPYLGILDQQMAMRWVKENIAAFGGDPDNVTIFGESAGGGSVSCHLVAKNSKGLFKRAIVMSGAMNLTGTQQSYDRMDQAGFLLKLSGCSNMDDLMKIPEAKLLELLEMETGSHGGEGFTTLSGLNNPPMRDDTRSIIPSDPYKALADGAARDVDVMIGTTADEVKYWAHLYENMYADGLQRYYDSFLPQKENEIRMLYGSDAWVVDKFIEEAVCDQDEISAKYPKIWERTELQTEIQFRLGSIVMAQNHLASAGAGHTYMYYFAKGYDKTSPYAWLQAGHSCELTYAFNNLVYKTGAPFDPTLTKQFSSAFVNFARTGNPSREGTQWTPYSKDGVNTMTIGRDCTMRMTSTPKAAQVDLLMPYYLKYNINN